MSVLLVIGLIDRLLLHLGWKLISAVLAVKVDKVLLKDCANVTNKT